MSLKNNIYTMSELKNRNKEIIENDDNPIWIRVQSALKNEGAFSPFPGTPDYSESHNKIYGSRSARSRFNNLRTDKILYRNYVLSTNNLLFISFNCKLLFLYFDIKNNIYFIIFKL